MKQLTSNNSPEIIINVPSGLLKQMDISKTRSMKSDFSFYIFSIEKVILFHWLPLVSKVSLHPNKAQLPSTLILFNSFGMIYVM